MIHKTGCERIHSTAITMSLNYLLPNDCIRGLFFPCSGWTVYIMDSVEYVQ